MWGGGRHHAHQLYTMYSSKVFNQGYNNMTHYSNPAVDKYLDKAMHASTQEEANKYWKLAQWDGQIGFSPLGGIPIIWLAGVDHLYLVNKNWMWANGDRQERILSWGREYALFLFLHLPA